MEGKKCRAICQNCQAVSEVYGQMLMVSIVVIAFSGIAATVFSDGGAVKPEHIPHTDLQENFNLSTNKIQIVHSGGEAIDSKAIKIIVNVNNGEKKGEFDNVIPRGPDGNEHSVFTLGDSIVIYTTSMNLKAGDDIVMYFIDTPSQQVIHTAVLQRGSGKIPEWITPHPYGSVYSDSAENGGWQPTESVADINDGIRTDSFIPLNALVTENYTFGIDAGEMGILSPFNSVHLKIIYQVTGNIPGTLTLRIFNGAEWTQIAPNAEQPTMPEYNQVSEYLIAYPDASMTTYNITSYVKTTNELEKLQVGFSVKGQASSTGILGVDFVGIQVK